MFKKILIANRGEVALRIMRTCSDMGVAAVAVFSDADRKSPHVTYAEEAYNIGPPAPRESYLNIEAVLRAAKECKAEAIHPGYGFLSENPEFAQAVVDAGMVFIGPTAAQIRAMGNKLEARRLMQKAGVPIVPGATVESGTLEASKKLAKEIGYPVLVKPAGGGGGKGMHVASAEEELEGALDIARRETMSSFGNATVYLERYLRKVRHIEIQIARDTRGHAIHLGERECSVQRRHQKIIEECPSVAVTEDLRAHMVKAALAAVNAVDYHGVGTLEFLVDDQKNFYFLEMNTRLQVEHTITERVTGVDLVKQQLLIASGEELSWTQEQVKLNGWAVECRISAEDPYNNFMPSPGTINVLYEPGGPGVRVDSGVSEGFEIPVYYDPMIAKLIAWGRNRDEAIRRMGRALGEYNILGIRNNIPFLLAIIRHPNFVAGDLHTSFLDEHTDLFQPEADASPELAAIVAALLEHRAKQKPQGGSVNGAKDSDGGNNAWRGAVQASAWRRSRR